MKQRLKHQKKAQPTAKAVTARKLVALKDIVSAIKMELVVQTLASALDAKTVQKKLKKKKPKDSHKPPQSPVHRRKLSTSRTCWKRKFPR